MNKKNYNKYHDLLLACRKSHIITTLNGKQMSVSTICAAFLLTKISQPTILPKG